MNVHRTLRLTLALLALLVCASHASAAGLSSWVDEELTPYLAGQLTEHPRFKGETVVFVALNNGAPAPVSNALVLALRDRLSGALMGKPGITIGGQAGHESAARSHTPIDCRRDEVHYYLGLDVKPLLDGDYRVSLRVLDAADLSTVTGTSKTWQGRLSKAQSKAVKQITYDEYFRGSREVPYAISQTDLLAADLAHGLTCQLLRQVSSEYVIATTTQAGNPADPPSVAGALVLVRNNLAGQPALQMTSDSQAANARLGGQAHQISGDLYQYWVTVTPTGSSDSLAAVSASTYIRVVGQTPVVASAPAPAGWPAASTASGLITPLSVVEPRKRRSCYSRSAKRKKTKLVTADHSVNRGECFMLTTRAAQDAAVFLINYQVIHGLVRLSGRSCRQQDWFSLSAGQTLQFPNNNDSRPSASAWQGHAGLESFYAIAVSDGTAAQAISRHMEQLPSRCGLSSTQGLTGDALQTWLTGLRDITQRWQHALDWQAVRIEHRY